MGATRKTNNTAEMQALIEALCWLNSGIEDKSIPDYKEVMVTVGSLFVKGLIDQKFMARENKATAMLLCQLWKVVSVDYGFCFPVNRPCLDCRLLTFRFEGPFSVFFTNVIALHHCWRKVCDGPI